MPVRRPGPVLARVAKAPVLLYELGGGRLLGHRFCMLVHRGRRSGLVRRTVVEVLRWDPARREAVVMSGFGRRSDWLLNVEAGGALELRVAGERFAPGHRELDLDEAAAVLEAYERRNRLAAPLVRAALGRLSGTPYDGSPDARRRLLTQLPLVAFRPRRTGTG